MRESVDAQKAAVRAEAQAREAKAAARRLEALRAHTESVANARAAQQSVVGARQVARREEASLTGKTLVQASAAERLERLERRPAVSEAPAARMRSEAAAGSAHAVVSTRTVTPRARPKSAGREASSSNGTLFRGSPPHQRQHQHGPPSVLSGDNLGVTGQSQNAAVRPRSAPLRPRHAASSRRREDAREGKTIAASDAKPTALVATTKVGPSPEPPPAAAHAAWEALQVAWSPPRARTGLRVRFLGASKIGAFFPTRVGRRKKSARVDTTESPPRKQASSPSGSPTSVRHPVNAKRSFVVQHSKEQHLVRDALLRRGWKEVAGGSDPQHLRRCLGAGSRGLGFVWLRGGDPIAWDYPREMCTIANRWPGRTSTGRGPGLGVLWRKADLLASLEEYYRAQALDPWRCHPLSFALPNGASTGSPEWESFRGVFAAVGSGSDDRVPSAQCSHNLWLLKPTSGSCGRGIGVVNSLGALQEHVKRQQAHEGGGGGKELWVVQKYVEAPLLYAGRKFDVRIFALLESSSCETWSTDLGFSLYAHREGYGRTSSEPFSLTALHTSMHLTNYAVQKGARHAGLHESGNAVSFTDLDVTLGSDVGFRERLVPAMHGLIADAVLAARPQLLDTLHSAQTPEATYRTLLAFDLILEADGQPLLLEVNPYPGFEPQNEWHGRYFKRLLDDYISACVDEKGRGSARLAAGRPVVDGHHVPDYRDDGWSLLLGSGRAVQSTGTDAACVAAPAPLFGVVPCGSRLVRAPPPPGPSMEELDEDDQSNREPPSAEAVADAGADVVIERACERAALRAAPQVM